MKLNSSRESAAFVQDGQGRALAGAATHLAIRRTEIVADITAAHASRMIHSGFLRRLWIRLQMAGEIRQEMRREVEKVAPRDALYAKH